MQFHRSRPAAGLICAAGFLFQAVPAQASSSQNIYGIVDACVARSDLGAASRSMLNGGCLSGSRLGFRGTEDLGGSLRAYFTLEMGFNTDDGAIGQGGRAFGRKALVGLRGTAGAIEMGRDYGTTFYVVQPVDPMGLGIGTASSTIWSGAPTTTSGRVNNSLVYLSPSYAGFSMRAQIAPGEQSSPHAKRGADAKGFNLIYRQGAAFVGLSHTRVSNTTDNNDDRATTLVAKYDFGRFSLVGIAQDGAWKGSRTLAAPSNPSSFFSRNYRSYLLGGSVKAGIGSINASFKRYDDRTSANFDADQWSINYLHPLSRRTTVYAGYSRLSNKRLSSYGVSDASTAYSGVTPGASTSFLAVGMRHAF
ncbi:porin [Pantoea sp. 18069]|uniref:porin n=1 Tax=Pantoea sp. 18069 TaxID=2681415 RepID=UPI0013580A69|nr:porin [Pantoea sp. 18069]